MKPQILPICWTALFCFALFSCAQKTATPFSNNAIATAHPLASQAGKKMYEQGGNAFDASVAAGFTLAVVEPSMSGIGGRLQAIYQNEDGAILGIDASTEVPANYIQSEKKHPYGYPTIGIPGVVAGLLKLHQDKGNLPLSKVMAPAIEYAENGFALLPGEASRQEMVKKELHEFEGSAFHFLKKDGNTYAAGEMFVQKDLAEVLKQIAQNGKAGFYEGIVAQKMVSDIQNNGGILTLEDLKNYCVLPSRVLKGKFQNNTVHSLFLPSYGAITIQILQILDHLPQAVSENQWAYQLGKATEIAYSYRKKQKNEDSLSVILSYEKAKEWATQIENKNTWFEEAEEDIPISWTSVDGHTTHLTSADQWGNVVSLTQTVGPNMGSKVATKELGFIYAVTLGGYLGKYQPGDRANSHISPTFITRNNKMVLALGAAGGSRIITAITQVSDRLLRQNHALKEALFLPRVYPFQDSLWVENHTGIDTINADFQSKDFPLKYIDETARFGRIHAIYNKNNTWEGAADPDWEGTTAYFIVK